MWTVLAVTALLVAGTTRARREPVWFYRALRTAMSPEARRMFGGSPAPGGAWPAACVLLDGRLTVRCSCSAVAQRFVLTAAHCVTPSVHYVARSPDATPHLAVKNLYRHRQFNAVQRDEGDGMDVVELHNDIGLAETEEPITWPLAPLPPRPAAAIDLELLHQRGVFVHIYGYGLADSATSRSASSSALYTTELSLTRCARTSWSRCACGASPGSGVCAGDSGGPVVYDGHQVGVTSMGPVACGRFQMPGETATSVLTAVAPYTDELALTMQQPARSTMTRFRPRMAAAPPPPPPPPRRLLLALCAGAAVPHLLY